MLRLDTPPARLRAVAWLEGLSYLVLLLVAMPLKYAVDQPLAVRIVGPIHGALFIWLIWLLYEGVQERGRSRRWAVRIGVLSVVPFGFLALERGLREEEGEDRRERPPR